MLENPSLSVNSSNTGRARRGKLQQLKLILKTSQPLENCRSESRVFVIPRLPRVSPTCRTRVSPKLMKATAEIAGNCPHMKAHVARSAGSPHSSAIRYLTTNWIGVTFVNRFHVVFALFKLKRYCNYVQFYVALFCQLGALSHTLWRRESRVWVDLASGFCG